MNFKTLWKQASMLMGFAGSLFGSPLTTAPSLYVWQNQPSQQLADAATAMCPHVSRMNELLLEAFWKDGRLLLRESGTDSQLKNACPNKMDGSFRLGSLKGKFRDSLDLQKVQKAFCDRLKSPNVATMKEVQIDFDAAVSQLDDYHLWLQQLRKCAPKANLTFTALPDWLNHPKFLELAKDFPNYVLQLHWIQKVPQGDYTIYNSKLAQSAVRRASTFGIPFRIALPAYHYTVALKNNALIGIEAEQGAKAYSRDTQLKVVTADWHALSQDVKQWELHPPQGLTSLLWFRLPLSSDVNALPFLSLLQIMAGKNVSSGQSLTFKAIPQKSGLIDFIVRNDTLQPLTLPLSWRAGWPSPYQPEQWEALPPYAAQSPQKSAIEFIRPHSGSGFILPPGQQRTIAWLRFKTTPEVTIHEFIN